MTKLGRDPPHHRVGNNEEGNDREGVQAGQEPGLIPRVGTLSHEQTIANAQEA